MATGSPTQRLADLLLGEPVLPWITARRAEGLSWRKIAQQLYLDTGIDVTGETVRVWLDEASETAA
jgi:hypothetical protein